MSALGEGQARAELARTPGWTLRGQTIERTYTFASFKEAMFFVNGVAALAERAGHHPDVAIHYATVTLSLWTHSEGGLTTKDFALAREIDGAFA
jgi:4a-hydroxytetrahydrobiopterin dehydratase